MLTVTAPTVEATALDPALTDQQPPCDVRRRYTTTWTVAGIPLLRTRRSGPRCPQPAAWVVVRHDCACDGRRIRLVCEDHNRAVVVCGGCQQPPSNITRDRL